MLWIICMSVIVLYAPVCLAVVYSMCSINQLQLNYYTVSWIPACMDQDHLSKSFNIMPKIMCVHVLE